MRLIVVRGRKNPTVYQVRGYTRKFVDLSEAARRAGGQSNRDFWIHFVELNTTRYRHYVPWIVADARGNVVKVPVWGTEPTDADFAERMLVDANWVWDSLQMYRIRHVRSVSGSKHYHIRWRNSPCTDRKLWCIWKDQNPLARWGGTAFMAVFTHGADSQLITVKDFRSYQPQPTGRFERPPVPEVLGQRLAADVPAS